MAVMQHDLGDRTASPYLSLTNWWLQNHRMGWRKILDSERKFARIKPIGWQPAITRGGHL